MKKLLLVILTLISFPLNAELANLTIPNSKEMTNKHVGVCAYYMSEDPFMFEYCTNNVSGKEEKYFRLTTLGREPIFLDDSRIHFQNLDNGRKFYVDCDDRYVLAITSYIKTTYIAEAEHSKIELISQRVPLLISVYVSGIEYMFILSDDELSEMKMVSDL